MRCTCPICLFLEWWRAEQKEHHHQHSRKATSISIHFKGFKRNMPVSITSTQNVTASIAEDDANGNSVAFIPGNIKWTTQDPTIATVVENNDGSATFTGLKVGTTQVTVTDTSNSLSAQDVLTVTAAAATSLVIKFGTPVQDVPATGAPVVPQPVAPVA